MAAKEIAEYRKEEEASGVDASTLAKWKKDWEWLLNWKKSPEAKALRLKNRRENQRLKEITATAKKNGCIVYDANTDPLNFGEKDHMQMCNELEGRGYQVDIVPLSPRSFRRKFINMEPFPSERVALVAKKV